MALWLSYVSATVFQMYGIHAESVGCPASSHATGHCRPLPEQVATVVAGLLLKHSSSFKLTFRPLNCLSTHGLITWSKHGALET
ncbi:hypothetical protein B0H11DRAFT_2092936, partial [Mycena galericulata]